MNTPNTILISDLKNINKQYNQASPINLTIDPYNILGITDYLIVSLDSSFYS